MEFLKLIEFLKGKYMKRNERIIWISIVAFLLFLSFFVILIKPAHAATINLKSAIFDKFYQVFNTIENDYIEENIDQEKLINGAVKGMLDALGDPHTIYLPKEEMDEMRTTSSGSYGGVGMLISEKDKQIVVVSPFEGSPAFKKGIKAGDIILSVDGVALEGKTVDEAAKMLKGEPGTTIKLEILSSEVKYSVDLKRAYIDLPTVKYAIISDKYGYLRISQFSGKTNENVKEALNEFDKKNVKGIIVDLRYNPGGLLGQVINIIDFFQNEGVIVSTKGRSASDTSVSKASKSNTIIDENVPVIVLIDKGSASASEIFAGAIKDTKRGILIGEKTFGKGSVQSIYNLGNDGFKMTIAKYYTPSNKVIDGIGIEPDLEIKEPELTDIEKESLKKIYDDKIIDDFAKKNKNPTEKEIDDFVNSLLNKGYKLPERYLKRMVKNSIDINNDKREIYDIEFDLQLKKALEIFDNDLIKRDKNTFYLDQKVLKEAKQDSKEIKKNEKLISSKGKNIFTLKFKADSTELIDIDKKTLDNIIKELNKLKGKNILVIGHTADSGSDKDQMRLSLKRAEFIANYLIKKGIPTDRVSHMGKGSTEPLFSNDTEENRQKNRRVEIIVNDNK